MDEIDSNSTLNHRIRVLIVDDSAMIREIITAILLDVPEIEVIGQAVNGYEAIEKAVQMRPDIITMDVYIPYINGLEATRRIMSWKPTPILIVSGHVDSPELNIVFEAMKAGALDVMAKPTNLLIKKDEVWGKELIHKIKTLAFIKPYLIENKDKNDE